LAHINTGGISPKGDFIEYALLLNGLQQLKADIYSVNEHNLDTNQPKIKRALIEKEKNREAWDTVFSTSRE